MRAASRNLANGRLEPVAEVAKKGMDARLKRVLGDRYQSPDEAQPDTDNTGTEVS